MVHTPSIPGLVCWRCGALLSDVLLPLRRLEECRECHADLHVCKMCELYDISVAKACREPIAEEVKDKERANFCDFFSPRPQAFIAADGSTADRARSDLEALFGMQANGSPLPTSSDGASAKAALNRLFGIREADE